MTQMKLDLIPHQVNDQVIDQRASDGYINATALCKAAGKQWGHYWESNNTKEFMAELESDIGIPISVLVQSTRGGLLQGTWIHPQVSIHLAQWLSAKFAVQVSKWVHDWMSGKNTVVDLTPKPEPGRLPAHLRRYIMNQASVPQGYFTVLQEITFILTGPLEVLGHELKEHLLPDGSLGKMFCSHLRDEHGINPDDLPKYLHVFEDGRRVYAKLYPNDLLVIFRNYATNFWLPQHAPKYFRQRDPAAIEFLAKLPALAAPTKPKPAMVAWR